MDLSFFPLTLEAVDQAAAESLCLFIGADERPLTGLAGLCDWRLSGKLSRLLRSGLLTGDAGEAVLTPPPGARLAFQKLFLFGMGRAGESEDRLAGYVAEAMRKLAEAGVQEAALQLPSRFPADEGIRLLLEQPNGPRRAMIFGPEPQKLIAALSQVASRGQGQANLERRVVRVPTPAAVPKTVPKPQQQQKAPAIPRASPLPFAPQGDLPAPDVTAPPPPAIPKASPLPFAPAEPLPAGPTAEPPVAPAVPASEPPPQAEPGKHTPPPPQRYVPPPPRPSVFDSKRKKKH